MQCGEREERGDGGPEAPGHGSKANYGGAPAPIGPTGADCRSQEPSGVAELVDAAFRGIDVYVPRLTIRPSEPNERTSQTFAVGSALQQGHARLPAHFTDAGFTFNHCVRMLGDSAIEVRYLPGWHRRAEVMAPLKAVAIALPKQVSDDAVLHHAGTSRDPAGVLRANSGQVLCATGFGTNMAAASRRLADQVDFEGKVVRRAIGWREVARCGR